MIRKYAVILAVLALFAAASQAQIVSTPPTNVAISFSVSESLTVTATPSSVVLTASGGDYSSAATPVTVTVNWNLQPIRSTLAVCQFLTLGTLPGVATNYAASINGGAAKTFNGTNGGASCNGNFANVGPDTFDLALTPSNVSNGTHSDSVIFSTTGLTVGTGSYSGTISYVAIAS